MPELLIVLAIGAIVVGMTAALSQRLAHPCPGAPVTSPFGRRLDPITGKPAGHNGTDFGVPVGTELRALGGGIVTDTALSAGNDGTFLRVTLDDGRDFSFSHLSRLLVREGDRVERGDVIALSGNSGRSTGPHLHLSMRDASRQFIDPLPFLA